MKVLLYSLVFFLHLSANSQTSLDFFQTGEDSYLKQDYASAIFNYTKAIEMNLNTEDVYYKRAKAKLKLSDDRGALLDYNKAIEINPNNSQLYYERAKTKFKLKDFESSIIDYDRAIKLTPEYAELYHGRAMSNILLDILNKGCCIESACLDLSKAGEMGLKKAYEDIKEYCH